MELLDLVLKRRTPISGTPAASRHHAATYQPQLDILEERVCMSVAAPTLQLAAVSSTQVKLTWTNVANESGYRIHRWDGTKSVLITQVAANVTTFTVGSLTPNQTQWFTVEAFNSIGKAYSAWVSVMTPPSLLTAPTNLQVGNEAMTQVSLSWTDATGETGYRIYGWDGARAVEVGTAAANATSFVVKNLSPGATYYFYVLSFNATNTKSTDWVTAQTPTSSITAPTNVKAQAINFSTIGLSWNDTANETGYRIYRWNGNSAIAPSLIATLGANTTGYQVTGLLPGVKYSFYVQAFNATASANSLWVDATTPAAPPLAPPTLLAPQVVGTSSVTLKWTASARAVGYRVLIWAGNYWSPIQNVPANTLQTTVSGLARFRTHWFVIQAYTDNFAEVSYSSAVFVNL